jgi:uncharacterized membrane protein
MTDYKNINAPRTIQSTISLGDTVAAIVLLIVVVMFGCHSCVEAIVKTVETEEEQRIFRPDTERPKAFRMSSPTPEQMDKYHELMVIQEVRR